MGGFGAVTAPDSHFFVVVIKFVIFNGSQIHSVKFAISCIFRCTVPWHEFYSHCCATATTIQLQNFKQQPPIPLLPQPLAPTIVLSVSRDFLL